MTNRKDLLAEKERKLAELNARSENAVTMVQRTIENLAAVNGNIQSTMEEIDTYMQRLTTTRNSLESTHTKNEKIMQNFSKLLGIEKE